MKKKLGVIILGTIIATILFTGCNNPNPEKRDNTQNNRFQNIYEQDESDGDYTKILKDTQTGKLYLWREHGNAGGLCELDTNTIK